MATEFDLLKEEYIALRSEILQSISKQHQITLGGYALTGAIFGYILGADKIAIETILVIPIVLIAMTSLWTVECNRNIRASYFIGYVLWPALKFIVNASQETGWETWIRLREGNASEFRVRHHTLQLFVIVFVPFLISSFSMILVIIYIWNKYFPLIIILCITIIIIWIVLGWHVYRVSDLSAITPKFENKIINDR